MGLIRESSYYTIANGTSWTAARESALALGGDLVAINSADENIWVFKNFGYDSNGIAITGYWIGLTDVEIEGTWEWSNNSEKWYPYGWGQRGHEPNGNGDHVWVKSGFRRAEKTYEEFVDAHNAHWKRYGEPLWDTRGPDWDDTWHHGEGTNYGVAEIPLSYFSVSDLIIQEGEKGKVTITRTGGTQSSQTLTLSTSDGTAVVGDDYGRKNKILTFAAGETSKTVNIVSKEDRFIEGDETFTLTLSASGADAVPAQISDGVAKVTITDDDWASIDEIRGSSYYTIVDGTDWSFAQKNAIALGGNLVTINDSSEDSWLHSRYGIYKNTLNQSIQDSELDLYWIGLTDQNDEGNWKWVSGEAVTYTNWHRDQPSGGAQENFSVLGWVSPQWCDVEHSYPDQRVVGGIAEIPLSYFSISDLTLKEGEKGKVIISRTGGILTSQTLTLTTSDGTAVVGDDYGRKNKTLTFAAGETSKTVNIVSKEDSLMEGDETFTLTLSASGADAVPAQISDGTTTVKIVDNDEALPHGNEVNGNNSNLINGNSNVFINSVDNSVTNITDNSISSIDNSVTIINNSLSNRFTDNSSTSNLVNSGNTTIDASTTNIDNSQRFTLTSLTSQTNQKIIRVQDQLGKFQDLRRPVDAIETGTQEADYLNGERKSNKKEYLEGGAGDDVLMGRQGGDVLSGGSGDDLIRAGHGRDVITGGVGGDTLFGGFGHNIFTGERDGALDTLSFKSDQHLWNWLYGKAGNNTDGSKLDVIHSLDVIDKIRVEGVETSQLSFEAISNFSSPTGNYSGIGIYSDGFLEAIYTGSDLNASQLQSMTVGVDA